MRKRVYGLIAVCLIFCMLLPHRIVEAASGEMKMDRSSKILYLNEDNPGNYPCKYDFSIKNKPANYKKKYNFTWYADDSSIVSVGQGGLVRAKKVGETKVKCKIKNKSTGKLYKICTATVTVKANAKK